MTSCRLVRAAARTACSAGQCGEGVRLSKRVRGGLPRPILAVEVREGEEGGPAVGQLPERATDTLTQGERSNAVGVRPNLVGGSHRQRQLMVRNTN